MQECSNNAYRSIHRALKKLAQSNKSWYALSRGREKQKKVKIVTVVPHSLSSLAAEVALFPSCSPQISSLWNCSQPPSREEVSRGDFQKRCLSPSSGTKPRPCGSKAAFPSQGHLKQWTLTICIRKPPFLKDQREIIDYINMKNCSSAKQVFLGNCIPPQLDSCGLCPTYSCY